jgi:murein DD-endopeptidase MepM/ murein hydrolase activator NlpD
MKADISIKRELQRTEIIDTASVHDLKLIPNAFYIEEALGWLFNNNTGKIRAEQMAIAHVRDKMRDMYQGHVLIRGFGAVRPHDCFYLDDPYNKIHGMVDVGRVVIHMGFDTGFVTSIKPDLCVAEVDDKTNLAYARLLAHGVAIGFAMARWVAVFHASGLLTKSSYARGARTIGPYARTALKGVLKFSGQMLTLKVGDGLRTAMTGLRSAARAVKTGLTTAGTALGTAAGGGIASPVTAGIGRLVGFVAAEVVTVLVFDRLFQTLDKYFRESRGIIRIYPLFKNGMPFVAGIDGHRRLIPGMCDPYYYDNQEECLKSTDPMGLLEAVKQGAVNRAAAFVDENNLGLAAADIPVVDPPVTLGGIDAPGSKISSQTALPGTEDFPVDRGAIKDYADEILKGAIKIGISKESVLDSRYGPRYAYWPTQKQGYSAQGGTYSNTNSTQKQGHNGFEGVEILAEDGELVYAIASGVVVEAEEDETFGKHIAIEHSGGSVSYYCHLCEILAGLGDVINCLNGNWQTAIGRGGDTGSAKGSPHLHLIMVDSGGAEVDPIQFLPPPR